MSTESSQFNQPTKASVKSSTDSVEAVEDLTTDTGQIDAEYHSVPDFLDQQIDHTIAAAGALKGTPTVGQTVSNQLTSADQTPTDEDELAQQIQSMLDDATVTEALDGPSIAIEPLAGRAGLESSLDPDRPSYGNKPEASESMDQISQLMAKQADQGYFESVVSVIGQGVVQPQDRDQPAGRAAVSSLPIAASGATAADVATELDSQPEASLNANDKVEQTTKPVGRYQVDSMARIHASSPVARSYWHRSEQSLKTLCGIINLPIARLSPEWRSTLGYIGAVNLFLAVCLIVWGLASQGVS